MKTHDRCGAKSTNVLEGQLLDPTRCALAVNHYGPHTTPDGKRWEFGADSYYGIDPERMPDGAVVIDDE